MSNRPHGGLRAPDEKEPDSMLLNYLQRDRIWEVGESSAFHWRLPDPPDRFGTEAGWWEDCNSFLYRKLPHAIFPAPRDMIQPARYQGGPGRPHLYLQGDGIVTGLQETRPCRDFLLTQAARHVLREDTRCGWHLHRAGMDWLRMFNEAGGR